MLHLLDSMEAARRLGLAESTLRKYRVTGAGPKFVKVGRSVRYRPADLESWTAAHVVGSTSELAAA